MKQTGEPRVSLFVFDNYLRGFMPFNERFGELVQRMAKLRFSHVPGSHDVVVVAHHLVEDADRLDSTEQRALECGYEGVMIRSLHGHYKHGRSSENEGYLLKVKRFHDCEAVVCGFDEKWHNANEATKDELGRTHRTSHKAGKQLTGTLGALKVRGVGGDYDGVEFDVGTGFSDIERQEIWDNQRGYEGRTLKVKYFPTGSKDKPRFPTFLGWRPEGA
jgi:DNA ligase-1